MRVLKLMNADDPQWLCLSRHLPHGHLRGLSAHPLDAILASLCCDKISAISQDREDLFWLTVSEEVQVHGWLDYFGSDRASWVCVGEAVVYTTANNIANRKQMEVAREGKRCNFQRHTPRD